jgi:hypothetical protein
MICACATGKQLSCGAASCSCVFPRVWCTAAATAVGGAVVRQASAQLDGLAASVTGVPRMASALPFCTDTCMDAVKTASSAAAAVGGSSFQVKASLVQYCCYCYC